MSRAAATKGGDRAVRGSLCQDCGDELLEGHRRLRCARCRLLVCSWCMGHVHVTKKEMSDG